MPTSADQKEDQAIERVLRNLLSEEQGDNSGEG